MAVAAAFLADTTRGAVVGRRASPRRWHVVKTHARRLVCAPPKFHCLSRHPTLPRVAAWLLAGSHGRGVVRALLQGYPPRPRPAFPGGSPERLCLKVGLGFRGSHSPAPRAGPGHSLLWGWGGFHNQKECASGPPARPRGSGTSGSQSETFLASKFSHEESGASSSRRRAGGTSRSLTRRLGCKGQARVCHCFHETFWKPRR